MRKTKEQKSTTLWEKRLPGLAGKINGNKYKYHSFIISTSQLHGIRRCPAYSIFDWVRGPVDVE
eukprot:scaffold132161_cov30-Tisochrysis_lutea.AAC.4